MAMFPYPGSAAMSLNNLSSLTGSNDDTKPKKPVLYRAGRAVGTGLNAAHQVAAAGDQAADQAINSGVDATKLGFTNFVRGVQGQPSLTALPSDTAANDPATPGVRSSDNVLAAPGNPSAPSTLTRAVNPASGADQTAAWWTRMGKPSTAAVPAGQLPVAPVLKPAIDSGVTLPGGRTLPYGAMVGGVPTFSDGSGGFAGHAASIPRTMSQADIQGLGDRLNVLPATALTMPVSPSDNTEQNVQGILASRQGGKFGITPEQNAAADLAAVTNQDPRSTLGRAALNASRSANAASTTLQRKAALTGLGNLQDAVAKNALQSIADPAALARVNAEGQSTLQRQALANSVDLARQNLANEGDLERTDLAGKYGLATVLANPKKTGEMTDRDYQTSINKGVTDAITEYNKNQSILPVDQRQPLTDQMVAEMRAVYAKGLGRPDLAPSPAAVPNDAQVAMLKKNPNLRAAFDGKFGKGAAAKVLGN